MVKMPKIAMLLFCFIMTNAKPKDSIRTLIILPDSLSSKPGPKVDTCIIFSRGVDALGNLHPKRVWGEFVGFAPMASCLEDQNTIARRVLIFQVVSINALQATAFTQERMNRGNFSIDSTVMVKVKLNKIKGVQYFNSGLEQINIKRINK